ncbi:hypothetical protein ACFLZ5_07610 [Thermodesulfobacteriota bacterium]
MKTNFAIILLITVGILGFMIGYSMAPTDVAVVRHGVSQQAAPAGGGHAASGGYGAESGSSGGYGGDAAPSGGYGAAPPSGGYGAAPAPASGGYGAAPAPVSGGYGAPPPSGGYGQ